MKNFDLRDYQGLSGIGQHKIKKTAVRKIEMFKLELVVPTEKQTKELFRQLSTRAFNISHKELPTYEEHKKYVTYHPYRAWFIIWKDEVALGNVYIQNDNSIGLNCSNNISQLQIEKTLNILTSANTPKAEIVLDTLKTIDKSKNQKNLPVKMSKLNLTQKLFNMHRLLLEKF